MGWKIVSHYTHGLLAGKFAEQLDLGFRPKYWVDTITAIIEHDDHLLDFEEGDYLTENGCPKDFTMSDNNPKEALEHAQRVYSNCIQKSQMVGLLVGRHLNFLYEGLAKDYGPMDEFLSRIRDKAKQQRKLYRINKGDEDSIYQLMRFCDRCSLLVCQGTVPEAGRKLEINRTIKDITYYVHRNESENFAIAPWPFQADEFSIDYEYRILQKPSFKDAKELKKAIENSEIFLQTISFKK